MNPAFSKEQADARPNLGRAVAVSIAGAILMFAIAVTYLLAPSAASNVPQVRNLGQTPNTPRPACPATERDSCMAVGSATVFQVRAGDVVAPYRVPFEGRIVAWSITLARPTGAEIRGFNDFYGSPPQARIAVLRREGNARPPVFKMVRQSPIENVAPFLGRTAFFALDRPLYVREGHIVALTLPTWAPNWAVNLSDQNGWRASRHRTRCADTDIEEYSRPQQVVGSDRQYGCFFSNTRFLYTATVARAPEGGRQRQMAVLPRRR